MDFPCTKNGIFSILGMNIACFPVWGPHAIVVSMM